MVVPEIRNFRTFRITDHAFCFRYLRAPLADILLSIHPGTDFMNITSSL
jgi:hypothetical protein